MYLYNLFKFKPAKIKCEEVLSEKKLKKILWTFLKSHLITMVFFQKRTMVFLKNLPKKFLIICSFSIMNYNNSHPELQELIKLPDNSTITDTKYDYLILRYFLSRLVSKLH